MDKANKIIIAFNYELGQTFNIFEGLPENSEKFTWLCVNCKRELYYKHELGCFQHKGNLPCDFEPETREHKTMKYYWFKTFPKFNLITKRKLEQKIGDQIIDVYFELRNRKKVAIECQNSQISRNKLIERTKNYTNKDIYVLWIFNGYGSFVNEEKQPWNQEKVQVSLVENRIHQLYGGRVYYMNVLGNKIVNPPYALHYAPYFEHKTTDLNYLGYDKYYRKIKSTVVGNIPNFKIICVDYKGYKLARFMDKHVSILCVEEINRFLRDLCRKSSRKKNKKDAVLKIPINSIISSIEKRFGYYLPYIILKKSNKVKKIKIRKEIDKSYNIQEFIMVKISDFIY